MRLEVEEHPLTGSNGYEVLASSFS